MKAHNLLNTSTARALQNKGLLVLNLKLKLSLLAALVFLTSAASVSIYNAGKEFEPKFVVLPAHHVLNVAKSDLVEPVVLGDSTTTVPVAPLAASLDIPSLTNLINAQIQKYIAQGSLQIVASSTSGSVAVNNGSPTGVFQNSNNNSTTGVLGGAPIVSYYPSDYANHFYGASVAGFTQISGQGISAGSANITNVTANSLTVNGTAINPATLWNASGSNISYTNGSVGIGTTTPNQALQVVGSISNVLTSTQTLKNVATVSLGGAGTIGVAVSGKYLYTTNLNNLTFSVVDITIPTAPVLMATTTIPGNSYGMYVAGNYAYVGTGNGLVVVYDVSNPKKPTKISQLSVGDRIQMLQVSGKYLYGVGLFQSKLFVIDVSNPYAPVNVGSSVNLGGNANYVYISGHYAYLTNGTSNLLDVIDVINPAAPVLVAALTVSDPDAIYVSGRYAYTTSVANSTMSVIDISNPLSPVVVATITVGGSYAGLTVSGRYAYLTDINNNKVSVVDISNPNSPKILQTVSVGSNPGSMAINGNYLYVANSGDGTASVIDISGAETNSLVAASADIGNLQVRNDILLNGQLQVYGGLQVSSGAQFNGSVGINVSTTTSASIFNITASTSSIMTVLGNGYVGIGTSTPQSPLSVISNYSDDYNPIGAISVSSNSFSNVYLNSYSGISWVSPIFRGFRAEGTMASATAVSTGDALARFSGVGYDGSNWQEGALLVMGVGNRTSGMPGYMAFFTSPDSTNALTQRMILDQNGNLGIGTTAPGSMLAVTGTSGSSTPLFTIASSSNAITLIVTANGRVGIGSTTPGHLISLSGGAYSDGASWANASDRNLKENFATITPIDALQKIDGLDIQQWNYKAENASTTHIGPTAQDFYAAFHLGGDAGNTSISSIDPAGVALLGIQALDQKISALQGSLTGNATTSNLAVYEPTNFSGDSVGEAKIIVGAVSVRINFSSAYIYQPVVTITSEDQFVPGFIKDKDSSGFTIVITSPAATDVVFDWHAFAAANAKLFVSDGSAQNIQLVVAQPPQAPASPPPPVVDSSSTPDSSLGSASSTPEAPGPATDTLSSTITTP